MEILISLILAGALVEFYAWLPRLSKWTIEYAVRGVCAQARERCREEWSAGIDALPNSILQFIHALSYISGGAAAKINEEIFVATCEELDDLLADTAARYDTASRIFEQGARDLRQRPKTRVQDAIDEAAAQLEHLPGKERQRFLQNLRAFGDSVEAATNRASDLLGKSLNKAIAQMDERTKRLHKIRDDLCDARNLSNDGRVPVWRVESALNGVRHDLVIAVDLLEGDDAAMVAHRDLVALINRSLGNLQDRAENATDKKGVD